MTYPAVELLVLAYLSRDFPDDYPDAWAAVEDFVANEPIAGQLDTEITLMLASERLEQLLEELRLALGPGYVPEVDDLSVRDWLLSVQEHVRELRR